ncbi:MAG: hypothetical protein II868_07050, partial [Butyrivibrio sp.]|nr:hypothetical protein [Butyrivibrio sp.]
MRITNKIMQNNSLYNINNNKVSEDAISTSIMTGKKVNRPSDDPVIAIRALRLRANVTELNQYYTKNAEDAKAWHAVTEGALTSISGQSSILVDLKNLVVAGPDKYKTLSDWDAIVTQIEQLSNEYYNVGNVDYAGRYAFTGYRTDTSLSFMEDTSKKYEDIQDEFNAKNIDTSDRVTSTGEFANGDETLSGAQAKDPAATEANAMLESNVSLYTVGRLRLSYDNLDITKDNAQTPWEDFKLQYRENMAVAAASTVLPSTGNVEMVNLSFTTSDGTSHTVHLPVHDGMDGKGGGNSPVEVTLTVPHEDGTTHTETYKATKNTDGTYNVNYVINSSPSFTGDVKINAKGVIYAGSDPNKPVDFPDTTNYPGILKATTTVTETQVSQVKMTALPGGSQETIYVPLSDETKQPYEMALNQGGKKYLVTVNTDGTYTLKSDPPVNDANGNPQQSVVQLNSGGAVHSSYVETTLTPKNVIDATNTEKEIDDAYKELYETYAAVPPATAPKTESGIGTFTVNAATGEILFSKALNDKLTSLKDIINANTLNTIYDKTNFVKGDTRPENLFACTQNGVKYNIGTAGHIMEYDVGYNQKIEVNTTANEVFTNDVKRDAQDLRRILDQMKDVDNKINILQAEYNNTTVQTEKDSIQKEIYAAKKAYDHLTDIMKDEFGAKITGVTKAIDMANNAVTVNGTRSKRLDLISSRLMDQTATFQELQSTNEDVDLAEAGTMLAMARL